MSDPTGWSVHEEGSRVIIEFECCNAYDAIELTELIAAGMREGYLEFEFDSEVRE